MLPFPYTFEGANVITAAPIPHNIPLTFTAELHFIGFGRNYRSKFALINIVRYPGRHDNDKNAVIVLHQN